MDTTPNDEIDPTFLAERRQFWGSVTGATKIAAVVIVLILIGLVVFVA